MPISGLVVSLSPSTGSPAVVEELARDPRLEVGTVVGNRIALVAETADPEEDRVVWDWIRTRTGVLHVDVAFIHFDDPALRQGRHDPRSVEFEAPNHPSQRHPNSGECPERSDRLHPNEESERP